MVYAIREPAVLLGMVLGFLAACLIRSVLLRRFIELQPLRWVLRSREWQRWLDPFGAVAVVISGIGWGVDPGNRRKPWLNLAITLGVNAVLAAAGLAGYIAVTGHRADIYLLGGVYFVLHGLTAPVGFTAEVLAGAAILNLASGLLALLPIPPMPVGVLVWTHFPKSPGPRRLAYHLLEEQWGVALVLVLAILPTSVEGSPLVQLANWIGNALLRLVA